MLISYPVSHIILQVGIWDFISVVKDGAHMVIAYFFESALDNLFANLLPYKTATHWQNRYESLYFIRVQTPLNLWTYSCRYNRPPLSTLKNVLRSHSFGRSLKVAVGIFLWWPCCELDSLMQLEWVQPANTSCKGVTVHRNHKKVCLFQQNGSGDDVVKTLYIWEPLQKLLLSISSQDRCRKVKYLW